MRGWAAKVVLGEHPDDSTLIAIATGKDKENEWIDHIPKCPRCSEKYLAIRQGVRDLSGIDDDEEKPWPAIIKVLRPDKLFGGKVIAERIAKTKKWVEGIEYSCLADCSVEVTSLYPDEPAFMKITPPKNGYVSAFVHRVGSDTVEMMFPASAEDDVSVLGTDSLKQIGEPKGFPFKAPTIPGEYTITTIWTSAEFLTPEDIDFQNLDTDPELQAFAELLDPEFGDLDDDEWVVSLTSITVKETEAATQPSFTDQNLADIWATPEGAREPRIWAMRAFTLRYGRRYWIPLVFEDLCKGLARCRMPYFQDTDLRTIDILRYVGIAEQKDRDQAKWFSQDVSSGDILIFKHSPREDEYSIVQVSSDYFFSEDWDPEKRGEFRHARNCKFLGVFDLRASIVPKDLRKALKGRELFGCLDHLKSEVALVIRELLMTNERTE
ncbi:hypothetical protein ACFL2Q_02810 [Thermodesulfobacteriota bacterium]